MTGMIYHLARPHDLAAAAASSLYLGSSDDRRDGFIHCSTAEQVAGAAARHRGGEAGLVLLAIDTGQLDGLRWEESAQRTIYPHIYGGLPMAAIVWQVPVALDAAGRHCLPELS